MVKSKSKSDLTKLGLYLAKKFVNRAELSRNTGLSESRLSELSINPTSKIRGDEIYLIALALRVDGNEILDFLYGHLKLKDTMR